MKSKYFKFFIYALLALAISIPVKAASTTTTHAVTVTVNSSLSLTADTAAFTLTMPDFVSGTDSNTQVVTYSVRGNNINQAVGAPALSASLGSLFTNTNLKATVGTYSAVGGSATLVAAAGASSGNYIVIGTTATTLATRGGTTKMLNGSIPVTYKATATADLPAGSSSQTVTVTLADV